MSSDYAWRIDIDHLTPGDDGDTGRVGPRDAAVDSNDIPTGYEHRATFKLYDDDKILYSTGTLYWNGSAAPEEHQAYGPLGDYGMPALGAVTVRYPGHTSWDCG
jgi:hypothetical protein